MTGPAVLEGRGIEVGFRGPRRGLLGTRGTVLAVRDASLTLRRGETLALVGESGSGKTTLGRALALLQPVTGGEVLLDGEPATGTQMRRRLQVIYQDPFSALNPRLTVRRLIEEPLIVHALGGAADRARRVAELMDLVGLNAAQANRFPHEFSGGQRQRIAIARALAIGPEILLADEPLSALDVSIQAQIINLLQDLKARLGLTLILISHDLSVVGRLADRAAVMHLGRIVEMGPADDVLSAPAHPYSRALIAAAPLPDPGRRPPLSAAADDDLPPPPDGCRFRARCPWAIARCAEAPALEAVAPENLGPGREVACHRWRDLPAPADAGAFEPPYRRRLEAYAARRDAALARRATPALPGKAREDGTAAPLPAAALPTIPGAAVQQGASE